MKRALLRCSLPLLFVHRWKGLALKFAPQSALEEAGLQKVEHLADLQGGVVDTATADSTSAAASSNSSKKKELSMHSETSESSAGPSPMKKGRMGSLSRAQRISLHTPLHRPVRGFTAVGLQDLAAAEQSMSEVMEAHVAPQPYTDPDHGEVTIIRVRTPDRPRLLADLTALIAGLGLSCTKALIKTEEAPEAPDGMAVNEFWVQEEGDQGMGAVRERTKRSAIEQRLRQWSATTTRPTLQRQAALAQRAAGGAAHPDDDASGSMQLPPWPGASHVFDPAVGMPWAADEVHGASADAALVSPLAAALMTPGVTWLGALPPCLSRRLAAALLPQMTRMQLAGGTTIAHARSASDDSLSSYGSGAADADVPGTVSMVGVSGEDAGDTGAAVADEAWLVLLEAPMEVTCSHAHGASKRRILHPTGAVLAAASSLTVPSRQPSRAAEGVSSEAAVPAGGAVAAYQWHMLHAPLGGASIVRVASRSAVRWLLGETRKATVRAHAQTLAGCPLFAPLGSSELLALCHRAVEVEAAAGELLLAGPPHAEAEGDVGGDDSFQSAAQRDDRMADASSTVDDDSFRSRAADDGSGGGGATDANRRFMVLLTGSAVVTYSPPPVAPSAVATAPSVLAIAGAVAAPVAPTSASAGEDAAEALPPGATASSLPTRLPISRLGPMSPIGALVALTHRPLPVGVGVSACGGATLLSWTCDEYLTRQLMRLPMLLSSYWAAEAPFALAPHVPSLLELLRPMTLPQMHSALTRAHSTADTDAASSEVLVVLKGALTEDVGLHVSIEPMPSRHSLSGASSDADGAMTSRAASNEGTSGDDASLVGAAGNNELPVASPASGREGHSKGSSFDSATGAQHLRVTVELASRDRLLADLSTTFAALNLDVTDANIATHPDRMARDVFAVRYRGELALADLEVKLHAHLRDALQVTTLRPGTYIVPDPHRLPTAVAGGDGGDGGDGEAPLVALFDLQALARVLITHGGELGALWSRCLQVRAPSLWTALQGGGGTQAGGAPTAQWLSELQAFMLLRLRVCAGGGHLEDGVRLSDLQLGPQLGTGAYGVVHLARSRVLPSRFYAVKLLHKHKLRSGRAGQELRTLERERELLLLLARACRGSHHRELYVRLLTSGHDATSLHLVMPAVLGGELFHVLEEFGALEETAAQFYTACLVLALQHLHTLGIAYRDLKAENVLLTGGVSYPDAGWPVLADMGLANFTKSELLHSFCGTPSFIAPEVARSHGYGTAADWWGLGVLVCQMLTLHTPFEGSTQRATLQNVVRNTRTLHQPLDALVSPTAATFIDALLQPDPADRLGGPLRASELRVHPFFWGLEWSKLADRTLTAPHAAVCRERALSMTKRMGFTVRAEEDTPWGTHAANPSMPPVPEVTLPAFAQAAPPSSETALRAPISNASVTRAAERVLYEIFS